MSLVIGLVSFGIRQLTGVDADAAIGLVQRHFTDGSRKLPRALEKANDRAWQAMGVALAGDGFLDQIKLFFAGGDDKGVREQVRLFLAGKGVSFEGTRTEYRRACLAELRDARKRGVLSAKDMDGQEVARQAAGLQRYADPAGLVDGATRAVARTADALADGFPNLARLVRKPVPGGPPLLAAVFCFFLRREVETDQELANGLLFDGQQRLLAGQAELLDGLGRLCESQAEGFAQVERALGGLGDRFDEAMEEVIGRLGRIEDKLDAAHAALLDMQAELKRIADSPHLGREEVRKLIADAMRQEMKAGLQGGELKPRDSLCFRGEEERRAVKSLLVRYRELPESDRKHLPALVNGLGKLQVGTGDFDGARASFAEAAQATADKAALAEVRYNAYRAALEARNWDDALAAITEAASLDHDRFELFPLHRYRPRRILGAGGFGTAFLCHDDNLDEEVVVKTLHAGDLDRSVGDLIREARLLRKLNHPAVIRVLDADYVDGRRKSRPYIVMESFPGISLEEHLKHGTMTVADLVAVARWVAQGMQAAHRLVPPIIHRDLKPDNVLVRKEGDGWQVRVIDFGLAMRRDALEAADAPSSGKSISAESVAGTLRYAPPEQLGEMPKAVPGPFSDVYAFGKMCCQALFLNTHPNRRLLAGIPAELADLLERCIEREPADRYQGFDEVLAALDALRPGTPAEQRQTAAAPPVPEPRPAPKAAPVAAPAPPAKPPRPAAVPAATVPAPPPPTPEPVPASCPGCQAALKVPANLLGKKVKCPKCGVAFVPGQQPPERLTTRLREEIEFYEKAITPRLGGIHLAPHTLEIAAKWAVLTRLVQPRHANLTLLQKLKLYDGKTLPGFTEDNVRELRREAADEGTFGVAPGHVLARIEAAIAAHPGEKCRNPFMVLHELDQGVKQVVADEGQVRHYRELLAVVLKEYEDIVKNEVQRAIAADEDALKRLCANYIDNVRAYTQREKVRNRYTGNYEDPDERLMRSVEEKLDVPQAGKDGFRRELMTQIGVLAIDGKKFEYTTNERLQTALERKLFEDQKDTIKLTSLVSNVIDKATQEKLEVVKQRLIRDCGYCDECAGDLLTFVASIFARPARQLAELARKALGEGRLDLAVQKATEALGLSPACVDALVVRASAYLAKGDHDKALADAERGLQLAPGDATALDVRRRAAEMKAKAEEGEEAFEAELVEDDSGEIEMGVEEAVDTSALYSRLFVEDIGGVTVVGFADQKIMGEQVVQVVGGQLLGLVEEGRRNLLLNLSNVDYLSSAAAGMLGTLQQKLRRAGGKLVLCNVSPEIVEMLEIVGLRKSLGIAQDQQAGLRAF